MEWKLPYLKRPWHPTSTPLMKAVVYTGGLRGDLLAWRWGLKCSLPGLGFRD